MLLIVFLKPETPPVAYLIGLPIFGYSLDIGKEHVNLIDERLAKLIYSGQLDSKELDRLEFLSCQYKRIKKSQSIESSSGFSG